MTTKLTIETRPFRSGDEALLLDGIRRAQAASGAAGAPCTLEELRWRYGSAPHGACVAFALDGAGRAVAGVAATRQRVSFEGAPVFWLEVGDLFNDFASGRGLTRARGLLAAGRAFAETFGGPAPEKHPVLFGLPDRRAHRFGLELFEWEVLRSENQLTLEHPGALPAAGAELALEPVARFGDEVELAFRRHAAGRPAVLVRDAAYLNWRYVERPGARFERVLVRRAGAPVGYAVHRDGWLHDLCADPADVECVAALLAWARERARAADRPHVALVVPDTAPEWLLFQRLGLRVSGTREFLCFKSFQRPAIMSWLFKNWSYSRGDTLR